MAIALRGRWKGFFNPQEATTMLGPFYLLLALPATLLTLYTHWRLQDSYKRYDRVPNSAGRTGTQVAHLLLRRENLSKVELQLTPATVYGCYDQQRDILRLSPAVAQRTTVAAMAVAAHKVGHAKQERDRYRGVTMRGAAATVLNVLTLLGWLIFGLAFLTGQALLAFVGLVALSSGVLFSVATLPMEFNASRRGLKMLEAAGLLHTEEERHQIREMLNVIALSGAASIPQIVSGLTSSVLLAGRAWGRRRSY
jgi:uncharacterized protein